MEFWELNLKENRILKIIGELEFWKLNYELEFWKLNLKEIEVLKINWELEFWKLNYEN